MKTNKMFVFLTPLIILFMAGCKKDYKTKTLINSDGSCLRKVVVVSPENDFDSFKFPIPTEKIAGWKINIEKKTKDTTVYVYTAEKKFDDVSEIQKDYMDKTKLGVSVEYKKKFRLFYTFHEYKETYKKYFHYGNIPLSNYINEDEYNKFLNGDTTKALKQKLDKYQIDNMFIEFWKRMKDSLNNKNYKDLNYDFVYSKRTEIESWLNKFEGGRENENEEKIVKLYGTKEAAKLLPIINLILNDLLETITADFVESSDYINSVQMPGIILATNATSILGNEANWKLNHEMFRYKDYEMKIESRVTNTWAFFVVGSIVLGLILLLIIPKIRKTA